MSSICESIRSRTSSMFHCSETNLGTEITTPMSYPDGEAISVYVFIKGDEATIHDGGMAAYNLGKHGQSYTQTIAKKAGLFAGLYGCEIRDQRIYRSCDASKLTEAIYTVASVCSFVGSLIPLDEQLKSDFEAKVLAVLGKDLSSEGYKLRPKYIGETGKVYSATAAIIDIKTGLDLAVIETVSGTRSVSSKFRVFYDLKNNALYKNVERLSVFDDTEPFSEGDIPLLQDVSNAVPFSALETRIMQYAR